jgi:hypothetical protein
MMNTTFPARCLGNTFAILFKSWQNNALLALSGGVVVGLVALSVASANQSSVVAMGTVSARTMTGNTTSAAESSYVSVAPYRVLDTRTSSHLAGDATLNVQVTGAASGVPAGAMAAVLNVTAVDPTAAGFLTVFPEGTTMPTVSNLNFAAGTIVPNLVTVGLSASGMVSIYLNTGSTNVLVDVEGYYASPVTTSGLYNAISTSRVFGSLASGGVMGAGQTQVVTVAGTTAADGVLATASAVVLNVTASQSTAPSFLTVFPAGVTRPTVSNLNFGAQAPLQAIANRVTVGVGISGQIDIYNLAGTVNVDVDVVGYYSGPGGTGSQFVAITPIRVADTRTATKVGSATPITAGAYETFTLATPDIPADATSVAMNLTAVPGGAPGYLTSYPTSDTNPPVASDVNWIASESPAVSNFTIANTTGTGVAQKVDVANSYFTKGATVNVIIDAFGYFAPVTLLPQTISFASSAPTGAIVNGDYAPTADSTSGLTVELTIAGASGAVCSISSGLVSFNHGGTCTIDASQAGNSVYAPADQVQQSFTVAPSIGSLTINVTELPAGTSGDISVVGPDGYTATVSSTTTLGDLASGAYTVNASSVPNAGGAYWPTAPSVVVSVLAGGNTQTTVDYANYVPDTTIVIPPADVLALTGAPGAQTITLAAGAPILADGDIIAIGIGAVTPNGLLDQVVSVTTVNGEQIATLVPATLLQAMPSGSFDISASLSAPTAGIFLAAAQSADWQTTSTPNAVALTSDSSSNPFNYSGPSPFSCTTSAGVEVNPSITVTPSFNLAATWGLGGLFGVLPAVTSARATGTVTATAALAVSAQAGASCTLKQTDLGPAITIPDVVIDVGSPIVVTPKLSFTIDGNGSVSGDVTAELKATVTATAGIQYTNANGGQFSPVISHSVSYGYQPPSVTAEADLGVTIGPELDLLLYGIAGPEVSVDSVLNFNANTAATPWWNLQGCLEAGARFVVPVLGLDYSDPSILSICQNLLQASTPPPLAITTTSPLPAAQTGTPYTDTLQASGGLLPYSWTATGLPSWLALDASTGVLSGTPTTAITDTFTVTATDSVGTAVSLSLSITVSVQTASNIYELEGVACSSATNCEAVGNDGFGDGVVVPIANGTAGTAQVVSGGAILSGVACPSATICYAVGNNSAGTEGVVVPVTNGTAGTAHLVPGTIELVGVACPSATVCEAVGFNSDDTGSVVVTITNGTLGTAQAVPGTVWLWGVACPSATICEAVGSYGGLPFGGVMVPITNGTPGTAQAVPGGIGLDGVACPSATVCEAVGYNDDGTGGQVVPIINGTPGTVQAVSNINTLNSVACSSVTSCYAVGYNGSNQGVVVPITNGTPGTAQVVPGWLRLDGVACSSATTCYAVGFDSNGGGVVVTILSGTPSTT